MASRNDSDIVVIKKYANRRLYNTARSSYVTLDDLAKMVRDGEEFAVYDAKTNEDITRSVLTQIIVEEEGKDQNMLPTSFLRQLIQLYGDPLQGAVPGYLEAAMQAFHNNQEQLRQAFTANPAMANFEAFTRSNMEMFERTMQMFNPFGAGAGNGAGTDAGAKKPEPSQQAGAKPDVSGDLNALHKQLREMQAQLEKHSRGK